MIATRVLSLLFVLIVGTLVVTLAACGASTITTAPNHDGTNFSPTQGWHPEPLAPTPAVHWKTS